jgi:hypothetical protein
VKSELAIIKEVADRKQWVSGVVSYLKKKDGK